MYDVGILCTVEIVRSTVDGVQFKVNNVQCMVYSLQCMVNARRGGGEGGYSPKFRIGVCRERSQTLTLSKNKENEN